MVQNTVFRLSPTQAYSYRIWWLRQFGAEIADSAVIRRTVRIECPWNLSMGELSCAGDYAILYCLGPVNIGDRASISQYAHLCAGSHDYLRIDMPLIRATIQVDADAWVAAEAFVGPGVRIGAGAILGARGAAFSDLEPWTIYGGNPAKKLKDRPALSKEAP